MGRPMLTIGSAVFDDLQGLEFTVQGLRALHPEVMSSCSLLVVDNNPDSSQGQATRGFVANLARSSPGPDGWAPGRDFRWVRYLPFDTPKGTSAPRQAVFDHARGDAVMCLDSHVLLPQPGSLARLLDYYEQNPGTNDLLSGPMLYDDLAGAETHFADIWRGGMWGTWGGVQVHVPTGEYHDRPGRRYVPTRWPPKPEHSRPPVPGEYRPIGPDDQPFEIGAMGLGLFTCRREAWPGFNPHFREFGGEEWYIHTKVRQRGGRCLCLPWLRWWHYFGERRAYPRSVLGKVRNYVLGHRELGLSLDRVRAHFVDGVQEDGMPWEPGHREANHVTPQQWEELVRDPEAYQPAPQQPASTKAGCRAGCGQAPQRVQPPAGATLDELFAWVKATPRDLDQHADAIRDLANQAGSVVAFVKRREWNVVLAAGRPKKLTVYQTEDDPLLGVVHAAIRSGDEVGEYTTHVGPGADSLAREIEETDMLVIDTVHHADRLWAELTRHGPKVRKRILLRGTGHFGEVAEGGGGPGLLHAVRRWVRENPAWTVIHHTREQYGISVLSCDPADKKELPSLWSQAVNAAKASWRAGANVLTGFGTLKDTDAGDRRLALCLMCPSHNGGRCGECGCPVLKKTSHATEACPLGHWHQEKTT